MHDTPSSFVCVCSRPIRYLKEHFYIGAEYFFTVRSLPINIQFIHNSKNKLAFLVWLSFR